MKSQFETLVGKMAELEQANREMREQQQPRIAKISAFNQQQAQPVTKNGTALKDLVGFPQQDSDSRNYVNTSNGNMGSSSKVNTSGRAGSSFRQKVRDMFRPSSRQKAKNITSMNTLPLSPTGASRSTLTLTTMHSASNNQENQQTNLIKNVQRIKLKKKSEASITPLHLAANKV